MITLMMSAYCQMCLDTYLKCSLKAVKIEDYNLRCLAIKSCKKAVLKCSETNRCVNKEKK